MQARRQEALEALGIMAIVPRAAAATPRSVLLAPESPDWGELADTVRECRLCGLCETRTQTVFGDGDRRRAAHGHRRGARAPTRTGRASRSSGAPGSC